MKEFACAALPWVLAGIAVALICAASGCRKDGAADTHILRHIVSVL